MARDTEADRKAREKAAANRRQRMRELAARRAERASAERPRGAPGPTVAKPSPEPEARGDGGE